MGLELYNLTNAVEKLYFYLDGAVPENISREQVRDLLHDITMAYVEYADSVDKAELT